MSDTSQGPGWWLASDGKWYPPETWVGTQPTAPVAPPPYVMAPAAGYPYAPAMPAPRTNGMAVASLVCACAGVVPFFFGLTCILGIVFGFVARSQIRKSGGSEQGSGLALAGIIVGFSLIVLFLIGVILLAVFASSTHCNDTFNNYNCTVN